MASLKNLIKAKKASARLDAPHARYSHSGQLSCALCGLNLKHESLWGSHIISKTHRLNLQKYDAEQAAAAEKKRKRDEEEYQGEDGAANPVKRARPDNSSTSDPHAAPPSSAANSLPAGFFADASQAPVETSTTTETTARPGDEDDPDLADFLDSLAVGPDSTGAPARSTVTATISAGPVKYEFGAPKEDEDGGNGNAEEEEAPQETQDERVEREMREEREDMLARLEEEEREQKEADEKVTVLKRRLEAIRAARQKKAKA
ncbi:hypothetical protein JCM11641_007782 [Rhodosporidiobolus odoratus]